MTGEIDLEGNIKQIGGVDEKFLGAYFEGIKTVLAPEENTKEINNFIQINQSVVDNLQIHKLKHFRDLLKFIDYVKEK